MENQSRCIKITDFKASHVKLALELVYGKKLDASTPVPKMLQVLRFANKYDMATVKEEIEILVGDILASLTTAGIASLLAFADVYQASMLKKRAMDLHYSQKMMRPARRRSMPSSAKRGPN